MSKNEEKIPAYRYSSMNNKILNKLFTIHQNLPNKIFKKWFSYEYNFDKNTLSFLNELVFENKDFFKRYYEEDLKANFIIPLLNKIKFKNTDKKIHGFYHRELTYETEKFILNGRCDFCVSKGIFDPHRPYFFIQEFKKSRDNKDPQPQLLAELISAIELNDFSSIKGAYIIGGIWNFVILKKLAKHKYKYYISQDFSSSNIEELKIIYKNLLFVKDEIIKIIDNHLT